MASTGNFEAILFDLDGTLIDTAPDMVATLISIQESEGHEPIDYEIARCHVSHGAAGLIKLAFPDTPFEEHERLRLWLDHFRYGPLEWLWRSLTWLKIQPFRR